MRTKTHSYAWFGQHFGRHFWRVRFGGSQVPTTCRFHIFSSSSSEPFNVTDDQRKVLQQAADRAGLDLSSWLQSNRIENRRGLEMRLLYMRKNVKEAAEDWLRWAKANRTEKYWKRQERILREDVLPAIGDLTIGEALQSCMQSM